MPALKKPADPVLQNRAEALKELAAARRALDRARVLIEADPVRRPTLSRLVDEARMRALNVEETASEWLAGPR